MHTFANVALSFPPRGLPVAPANSVARYAFHAPGIFSGSTCSARVASNSGFNFVGACPRTQLKAKYERLDGGDIAWGQAKHALGLDVVQDETGIHISQGKLVDQLLEHYVMKDAYTMKTPVTAGTKISKGDCPEVPMDVDYRHGVAIILYLSTVSRPDLCFTASQLGRVQCAPDKAHHMKAMLEVCRYLKGTRDHGISFPRYEQTRPGEELDSFADAGWANNDVSTIRNNVAYADLPKDDGKSSGGYMVRYNTAPIEFKSKVISTICLSTAEAELKATSDCGRAIVHIRNPVEEMKGKKLNGPTILYEDATAVISQCEGNNYTVSSKVRHIGVAFWYLRELVEHKKLVLKKIDTKDQLADIMTKFLPRIVHHRILERILIPSPQPTTPTTTASKTKPSKPKHVTFTLGGKSGRQPQKRKGPHQQRRRQRRR